jgi:hypothetical protein
MSMGAALLLGKHVSGLCVPGNDIRHQHVLAVVRL